LFITELAEALAFRGHVRRRPPAAIPSVVYGFWALAASPNPVQFYANVAKSLAFGVQQLVRRPRAAPASIIYIILVMIADHHVTFARRSTPSPRTTKRRAGNGRTLGDVAGRKFRGSQRAIGVILGSTRDGETIALRHPRQQRPHHHTSSAPATRWRR
jgi:hypothetical protein